MYEETQLSFSSGLVMDLPMALVLSYGLWGQNLPGIEPYHEHMWDLVGALTQDCLMITSVFPLVSIKRTFVYSIGLIILTLTHPSWFSLHGIIAFDLGRENGNCGESSEDGVDHLSPMLCAPHYSLESRCDWIQLFSSPLLYSLQFNTLIEIPVARAAYVFQSSIEPTRFSGYVQELVLECILPSPTSC
jgi:hypothetical protein